MKITAFNPLILTSKAAEITEVFESLGFEHAHKKVGTEGDFTSFDMKLGEDFRVDVTQVDQMAQDNVIIRMNVRDFDEAYELLLSKGFTNVQGDRITDTGSSKAALMISPSGFGISISEHIRK